MIKRRLHSIVAKNKTCGGALIVVCLLSMLAACGGSGDPEEGGLIGTGIIRGTVSEKTTLAAERIDIKASTGEKSTAALNGNRRFSVASVDGASPYLLRSDLGNGEYRYAVGYENTTANVHSYSDVVIRAWFGSAGRNIDNEFNSSNPIADLPTQDQFDSLSEQIFAVIGLAFREYGVTGNQLLTSDYNANDRGIDEYLDNNPVIISNGTVSVLLTDPVTKYQNELKVGFSLSEPITSVTDTSSPVKVSGVKVLGSGLDQMVVVWDQATDNVGVIAYQVSRDGGLVGTTPFPVFTDTGLQPNSTYSYEIVAIDAAGLSSIPSDPEFGQTLAGVDVQPPPVPTRLRQIETSANRLVVGWTASNVSDVVAFEVYRGTDGATPEPLIRTTSTEVTDPSVSGGTEYCYQVVAIDASGNTSERSDPPFCLNTTGNVVTPTSGNIEAVSNLVIPDVDSIDCSAVFPEPVVTVPLTLDGPCYSVTQNVSVSNFADLIIEAGTVLKFDEGVGLKITSTGSMSVNGTPQSPVVFTGKENAEGYWRGIHFEDARSMDNRISHAVIEFAGYANSEALLVTSTVGSRARLSVNGSLIRYTAGYGISFSSLGTDIVAFDDNVITDNDKTADIGPLILPMLGTNNDFTGNLDTLINVPSLTITSDLIIPDLGVPLKSNGLVVEQANLTIDAGVGMRFQPGKSVQIYDGDLLVNGTLESPVLLSGLVRESGSWGGVHLIRSAASNIKNTTIEYGGAAAVLYNANLGLQDSSATVSNVTLRYSSGYGVFVDSGSSLSGVPVESDNVLQ